MLCLCLLAPVLLGSCAKGYQEIKEQRAREVNRAREIKIAVIWDRKVKDFLLVEGVVLAADELNRLGGVAGRRVRIEVHYSKNDQDELALAKQVANDTSVAAVIGHRSSGNAIPASVSYEYHGLLYVAPSSSHNNLTNHGFAYTFRTLPSDGDVSWEIASFMKHHGHKKIAVVDDRSVYGKGIADGVMESCADFGLQPVIRRHYTPGKTDYKQLCAELMRAEFSAVFLGGGLPHSAELIRVARKMGLRQRIYAGAALDSRDLVKLAGSAAEGTVVPTSFNPNLDHPATRKFVADFRERFGKAPDTRAALGYDSLNIIAEAIRRGESVDPAVVASHIRFFRDWQGVTGGFTYDLRGDLVSKKVHFKSLERDAFVYLPDPAPSPKAAAEQLAGKPR